MDRGGSYWTEGAVIGQREQLLVRGGSYWTEEAVIGQREQLLDRGGSYWTEGAVGARVKTFIKFDGPTSSFSWLNEFIYNYEALASCYVPASLLNRKSSLDYSHRCFHEELK